MTVRTFNHSVMKKNAGVAMSPYVLILFRLLAIILAAFISAAAVYA
jgi:hypothetical protein